MVTFLGSGKKRRIGPSWGCSLGDYIFQCDTPLFPGPHDGISNTLLFSLLYGGKHFLEHSTEQVLLAEVIGCVVHSGAGMTNTPNPAKLSLTRVQMVMILDCLRVSGH